MPHVLDDHWTTAPARPPPLRLHDRTARRNVQFPRAIREEGVSYLVDKVVPSADGSFYRVQGTIRRLLRPGETVAAKGGPRKAASTKATKTPATAADLPTCTEIGTGVLVQCVPEGKKLRARVVSDGYNPDWNIRYHVGSGET